MDITFELLSKGTSEFLRNLRNENRGWFSDTNEILPEAQWEWVNSPARLKELNLIIKDSENKEKVGFLAIYDISSNGYATIGRMMTVYELRHKGYMKRAMIKAFELARKFFGIKELNLSVRKENVIATEFYIKMGFITYGLTDELYIMRKAL